MAFSGAFVKPFRPAFDAGLAAASVPWYLAGGAPTPAAVWQPIRAASLAASYLRIAGSVGNANLDPAIVGGVAPSFDAATGWGVNGINQYLKTGIFTGVEWSVMVQFASLGNGGYLCGASNSGLTYGLAIKPDNNFSHIAPVFIAGSLSNCNLASLSSGSLAIAGRTGYRNGVAGSVLLASQTGTPPPELYIGTMNYPGSWYVSAIISAVAIWDTSTNHAAWMPAVMAACALI